MTLIKIQQMSEGKPFLRSFEVDLSKKIKFVSEIRDVHTKFDDEGEDSMQIDIELLTPISDKQYEVMIPSPLERKSRVKSLIRTWFVSPTNFNFLIDTFGDQEKDWVNKTIELVTIEQDVYGTLKKVIYCKGAKSLA